LAGKKLKMMYLKVSIIIAFSSFFEGILKEAMVSFPVSFEFHRVIHIIQ